MNVKEENGYVSITGIDNFSVAQTFDCGQSFRFKVSKTTEPDLREIYRADGIAFGKAISFIQPSDDSLIITPCTLKEYREIWEHYLAFDVDYTVIREEMRKTRPTDSALLRAMEVGKGIRILRQAPWETLCTFIISQNNNIPRITSLVAKLCQAAGTAIPPVTTVDGPYPNVQFKKEELFSFPAPEAVKELGIDGIFALKTGFRASYIYDAASKLISGETDISSIFKLPTDLAAKKLCTIRGVGPKVAACTLLFGFEKNDAFPIDVWVKRVLAEYYPDGITPQDFGDYAGLAQQYLFYYQRYKASERS